MLFRSRHFPELSFVRVISLMEAIEVYYLDADFVIILLYEFPMFFVPPL